MHGFVRVARTSPLLRFGDVGATLTYAIELAVGLGCLVAAGPTLRGRGLRWLGVVLLAAGISAVVHAGVRLAT